MFDPITFLSGGAAGSILTLFFTGRRDKKQRRHFFLGFLKQWHSEIETATHEWGSGGGTASEVAYHAKVAPFHSEVERVRDAFCQKVMFDSLTKRLANLKAQDWDKKQPRDVILEALDELIRFEA